MTHPDQLSKANRATLTNYMTNNNMVFTNAHGSNNNRPSNCSNKKKKKKHMDYAVISYNYGVA